jgi:hypothetical protein
MMYECGKSKQCRLSWKNSDLNGGIIKESGLNLTAGCILFCAIDIRIKNRLFTTYFFSQNRIVNKR